MKQEKDFKLECVPLEKVAVVLTSDADYEESRLIFVEDFPDYGEYLIVDGGHCSCYGWGDVTWDATFLNLRELGLLLLAWDKQSYGLEARMASMIRSVLGLGANEAHQNDKGGK